jgi:H+-transporting ATPase
VIIDAIKESRRIVQRMNSYAIYRISETLRVLVFVTAAILVFNFFPVTAIMIVLLALLNDGSILSIAYDNVHYKDQPEAWNMRLVLGMATVLGLVGPIAAFGLFYLGDRVLHFDRAHVQTLMYLMLSVGGSLTIFLARTRGPFWSIRPKRILLVAVLGAEAIATLLAGFGIFMTALGWGWVALVWGYALVWFLITDRVKLLGYRILDPVKHTPVTNDAAASASACADGPKHNAGSDADAPPAQAAEKTVLPFHTGSNGAHGVYHDNPACPHGQAIVRDGNALPGRDDRRRCAWCDEHGRRPCALHAATSTT